MTKRVIILKNPMEPSEHVVYDDVVDVPGILAREFSEWPDTARIYHNFVSQQHDVTPADEAGIELLDDLEGDIFVVVYPSFFVGFLFLALAVVAVVAVVVLLAPKVPEVNNRNQQAGSPNNDLAERSNRPRINARIPDIYGVVRSTPDMLMPEYKYYEANKKVEVAYMAVGRGQYTIYDVRDDATLLGHIPGASAAFYGPNTSPNSGSPPQFAVGAAINEPLVRAKRLEQVVGQELRPPNAASATSTEFKFQYPDRIYNSVGFSFQDRFVPDDQLTISGATFTGVSQTVSETAFARYVHNNGTPYVEWQSGNPSSIFLAGDDLVISGSSTTGVKDTFTVSTTRQVSFSDTGRIYFEDGNEPVEAGLDLRVNKDFTLSGAVLNYDYQGTYTITAKTSSKLTLSNPAGVNPDWTYLQDATAYSTVVVNGISRSVRFTEAGEIELQAGNFDDVNFPTQTTVTVGAAPYTTNLNGTYQYTARSTGQDYWQLNSPETANAEWLEINGPQRTRTITVTIEQIHTGDTQSVDFNGTYNIASVTSTRIYLTNPAAVNSDWNLLSGFVSNRTEYGGTTDTFQVLSPTRTVNLNGTYSVVSVGLYEIILSNPAAVRPDWAKLEFFPGGEVKPASSTLATDGNNWIGPFFIDTPDTQWVYCNFQAPNGLYKDDGKAQTRAQVNVDIAIYPADANGQLIAGTPYETNLTLSGSAVQRDTIADTRKITLPAANKGYGLIYARRTTPKDTAFEGQVIDTVKWEDVYILSPETKTHFGDVTTVHAKTYATGGALALKERKLNCLVGRKIPIITGFTGSAPNFTPVYAPDLQVSTDGAQIFCALSLDPKFGTRAPEEIDYFGILAARSTVNAYFGSTKATEFSYTFDNTNVSYEEAATAIANTCFCVAYRQGSLIRWKPEIATNDSVLIFNHRNKLPDSETRTVRFASENDHDSIQLEWINPDDDSVETFFIPEDQSGVSPKKIDVLGIRNITQATWHAWRGYYKTQYQNTSVEFEATQEAAILINRDRVLIADNTRAKTQDGEIVDQEILQLTLSQDVELLPNVTYTCFIQHVDGTVEAIPCTPVPNNITGLVRNVVWLPDGGFRWASPTQAEPNNAEVGIFSVGDSVSITVTSFNHPTLGTVNLDGTYEVAAVDGISGTVMLKDPELVDADWTKVTGEFYRAGVNFNATKNSRRKINLAWAPRLPLNLSPDSYSRATFLIRGNDEVAPQAFMVAETRPKDNFTYQVTCTNYDPRFYYLDDLEFWLNFDDGTFRDASARAHNVSISTAAGKAAIAFNSTRQSNVFNNAANSSAAWVQSSDLPGGADNYTKAAWVRHSGGFDAYFLTNANEQFRCNGSNRLIAGHGAITLTYPSFQSNAGVWHHIACTYEKDIQGGRLRLYYDGLLVAQRVGVPAPAAGNLQPIGNGSSGVIYSQCDDVRYWRRAFTEGDIQELYNSTR